MLKIIFILVISFCIWPGSLILWGIKKEKKTLNGHTSDFCAKHLCKHCEVRVVYGIKGKYYEYKCKKPYCVIDNRGKQEYDIKQQEAEDEAREIKERNTKILIGYFKNNESLVDFIGNNKEKGKFINDFFVDDFIKILEEYYNSKLTVETFIEIKKDAFFNNELAIELLKINKKEFDYIFKIIAKDSYGFGYYRAKFFKVALENNRFDILKTVLKYCNEDFELDLYDTDMTQLLFFTSTDVLKSFCELNLIKINIKNLLEAFNILSKLEWEKREIFLNVIYQNYIYNSDERKGFITKILETKNTEYYDLIFRKGNDINTFFQENSFIVFDALKNNDEAVLEWLKSNKVNLNIRNEEGITPLIYAIIKNKVSLIDYLLESNIDINYSDQFGDTPLLYLCYYKKTKLIKKFYNMNAVLYINIGNYNEYKLKTGNTIGECDFLEKFIKTNSKDWIPIVLPTYIYRKNKNKRK